MTHTLDTNTKCPIHTEGTVVKASTTITEGGGDTEPEFNVGFWKDQVNQKGTNKGYVHAREGDIGYVALVDDGTPTVYWWPKGTGTIVSEDEIDPAPQDVLDHIAPEARDWLDNTWASTSGS